MKRSHVSSFDLSSFFSASASRSGDASLSESVDGLDVDSAEEFSVDLEAKSSAERLAASPRDKEMVEITSNRSGARELDPDRHLHRIRH